jgi:hypothetical protein
MRAFTRAVSPRLPECQLTHLDRIPIDAAKAAEQHAAYERALSDAGFAIVRLPELVDDPDAVFVEDTALLLGEHAIITRPGAASRIGETDSTAAGLAAEFELHRIERGFLDGGDVLRIGRTLYVGLSTRTDAEGIGSLSRLAAPLATRSSRPSSATASTSRPEPPSPAPTHPARKCSSTANSPSIPRSSPASNRSPWPSLPRQIASAPGTA